MKWLKRMSSILLVVPVLSIVSAPLPIGAATYYVDPVNGSNAHDGLTPATAWKMVLPAGSGHTIVTLGEPEAPRKSTGPAGASALRAPGPATLDTGEVQRVVLGAEQLTEWSSYLGAEAIWRASLEIMPYEVLSSDGVSPQVELQQGCFRDILDPGEWFWDGLSGVLYLNDAHVLGKMIEARGYDSRIDKRVAVTITRWEPSPSNVVQVPSPSPKPIYLMLDDEFYPESDWWWGRSACSFSEWGDPNTLYMRYSGGNPDAAGRATTVVREGGGWSGTTGDFNGDGLRDVVTSDLAGHVFVHFGSAPFTGLPDHKLTEAGESTFGFQVASAGDVNKDGFDDLLVGFGWGVDKVYLYQGSDAGFETSPVEITPPSALPAGYTGENFGHSLSISPGDVNADGYDDVLVGAGGAKNYVCVYLGSSTGTDRDKVQVIPYSDGGSYISLSHVGDLDGDGLGDIATSPSQMGADYLQFHVYRGSNKTPNVGVDTASIVTVSLLGGSTDSLRNLSPGPAGDLNGDGFDDLLVGNQWATGQYPSEFQLEGKAHIFYGSPAMVASAPDVTMDNPIPGYNTRFGVAVTGIGDFNHDGDNDVMVGCPYSLDGGFGAVYYGPFAGIMQAASLVLQTPHSLGWSLAHVGNLAAAQTNYIVLGEEVGISFLYGIGAASVPDAPTQVTAVSGNGQATVSFTAPAPNGSPITLYTVTSNPGGITATGTASPIIMTGLMNGTAYSFTVTATNAVGTGPASAPSNSVTQTAPVPPSAPSGLAAHGTSIPFAVSLSWADNSNNEDGFTIQRATNARFTAGLTPIPVGPNLSVFSDSTAMPLTRYYYRVQAFNGVAQTAFSNPVNVRTPALPVHVGGLGGLIHDAGDTRTVDVTVTVLDGSNQPASGVKVMGKWTGGRGGARSCTTDGAGQCTVNTMVKEINGSVNFGVKGMKRKGCKYDPASNVQTVLTVQ